MSSSQKRSSQVKITVTPEMHERLRAVAEKLGQTPATLASIAVSQFVASQESALGAGQRAVEALVGQLGPQLGDLLERLTASEPA